MADKVNLFLEEIIQSFENKELIKLVLSNKKDKISELKTIIITIVLLKKGYHLNFVYRYNTKDVTKNFLLDESIKLIKKSLESDFFNADLFTTQKDLNLVTKPNGNVQINSKKPTKQKVEFNHNKTKNREIKTLENTYLRELGILNEQGEVRREMNDKYRQINKYIELLKPYLTVDLLHKNCQLADMGSGKGYLTFALYDFITNTLNKQVQITGVEFREDLVTLCNSIAKKAQFENLSFIQGTIEKSEILQLDILIALHACDTATDDAIFCGISAKASLIVCAPCCHKQIRKEMNVTSPLNEITKFGILKERQAEIITDTLRAMIMEANGYKTTIFEFISTEHTSKNLMIVGEKINKTEAEKRKILEDIEDLKIIFGINHHYLEELLAQNL